MLPNIFNPEELILTFTSEENHDIIISEICISR